MKRETVEAYGLGAIGLVIGVYEVVIRPFPGDAIEWLSNKLIDKLVMPQEELDIYIDGMAEHLDKAA